MPSKPNILIVGPPGSGKSSSFEELLTGLRAGDVAFFDFERKGLPFLFDPTKLAQFSEVDNYHKCIEEMNKAKANPKAKVFVYDSLSAYLKIVRDHAKSVKTGWDVWNMYNAQIANFLNFNKSLERLVICTIHDEVLQLDTADGGKVSRVRAFVQGKEYEGKLEGEFLIVLSATVQMVAQKPRFVLRTITNGLDYAKAPRYLQLPDVMDNNINKVLDKIYEHKLV